MVVRAFPSRGKAWRAWREFANQDRLLVLDGATGSELTEVPGIDWASQWSGWPAQLSLPDAVKKVHRSYIEAGADVVTANTYCANRHVMGGLCKSSESSGVDMVRLATLDLTMHCSKRNGMRIALCVRSYNQCIALRTPRRLTYSGSSIP